MHTRPLLLCFNDELALSTRIADLAHMNLATIAHHRFPDGEIKLSLPTPLPTQVVILRSLAQPNDKLIELLLSATTARQLGARHVTCVAPYLAYMRQDIAFHPGEVVSQRIVGHFLAGLFDTFITVDPHLHRVATLQEAVPTTDAIALSAAPLLADLIVKHRSNPILIGPDQESQQWVSLAAQRHHLDYAVCTKTRRGDRDVQINLPTLRLKNRQIVLLDDVASTGQTVAQAARLILAAGATSVDVAVTHALFAGEAVHALKQAGVNAIWSTDCIAHATNAISVAPLIAATLIDQASKHQA